jgi:signal transduction histidine kinase
VSKTRSLRRQIILSFVAFAASVSALFAMSGFLVAYVVEDAIFEDIVAEELARQQAHWREQGKLAPTRNDWISIHQDAASFPADLRREVARQGRQEEYSGQSGRHYHVTPFPLGDGTQAFAVAEVGDRLAVRPLTRDLVTLLGSLAAMILLVAAGLGYWLATRATAPLSRLVEKVSTGVPGELPQISAADFPRNEIGTLAATLEAMLERTRAFIERETRFTRDASHELRTPIAVILTSTELIQSKGEVPSSIAKPIARIEAAARQMEQSVDLLLLLAREEIARSPAGDVALLPLIEDIVLAESARLAAERTEVTMSVPASCRISIEERVATTIIGNLVANAFTHARGSAISIGMEGDDLVVADQGSGLPSGILQGLSSQAIPAEPGGGSGPGLGLSIVSRLCRLHDIGFSLENRPGGGAIARVGLRGRMRASDAS